MKLPECWAGLLPAKLEQQLPALSPNTQRLLQAAFEVATKQHHQVLTSEHLLLAMALAGVAAQAGAHREGADGDSSAAAPSARTVAATAGGADDSAAAAQQQTSAAAAAAAATGEDFAASFFAFLGYDKLPSRAILMLASLAGLEPAAMATQLIEHIRATPIFRAASPAEAAGADASGGAMRGPSRLSQSMLRVFEILVQFAGRPVADASLGMVFADGLVATEFLAVCLSVEGTCRASQILGQVSGGRINSRVAMARIHLDPQSIQHPAAGGGGMTQVQRLPEDAPQLALREPWHASSEQLPAPDRLPAAPTAASNWLIPGRLLIGSKPYDQADLAPLVETAGVTTFVNLIAEFGSLQRYLRDYPRLLAQLRGPPTADCLFFPIYDFDTVEPARLAELALDLARRLETGEVLFVHCRGGHGRTGMVVITLLSYLYARPVEAMQQYVQKATHLGREEDRAWGPCHMPETDEQVAAVRSAVAILAAGAEQ